MLRYILGPVKAILKNATKDNLRVTHRSFKTIGYTKKMATHFLPLIVFAAKNPHSLLRSKEKNMSIVYGITSEPIRTFGVPDEENLLTQTVIALQARSA
jgi:hypothetical protein